MRKFALVTTRSFFLQARFDFVKIAVFSAKFDKARLQSAFAFVHEDDVCESGRQNGAHRHGQAFAHVHCQLNVHIHVGPQFEIGVLDINPHAAVRKASLMNGSTTIIFPLNFRRDRKTVVMVTGNPFFSIGNSS